MRTTILNHIKELQNTASRTGLIYSDNAVMFSYFKDLLLKLEQIEELLGLENEVHLTDVAEAVKHYYQTDTNLTHINVNFQVRPIQSEKKECIINAKIYL
jgi:hypothetical protein